MWRGPIGNVNSGENGCRKMHNFALSLTVMGSLKIFLLPPPLFFLGGRELFHPLETHAVCFPPFSLTLGLRPPRGEASYAGLCLHPPPQPAQGGEEGQGRWGPRRRVLQGSWAWREREGHGRGQSHARLLQEVWAGLAAYHSGISSRVTPSRKLSLMSLPGVIVPNAIVYFLCSPYRYPKLICSLIYGCVFAFHVTQASTCLLLFYCYEPECSPSPWTCRVGAAASPAPNARPPGLLAGRRSSEGSFSLCSS